MPIAIPVRGNRSNTSNGGGERGTLVGFPTKLPDEAQAGTDAKMLPTATVRCIKIIAGVVEPRTRLVQGSVRAVDERGRPCGQNVR